VGLVCRVVEQTGIATVCVSTGLDLTRQVRPPRSIFINHPMGNNFGRPRDVRMQREILLRALKIAQESKQAGILVDPEYEWGEEFRFNPGGARQ
jgi:hypothetical protein